MPMIQAVVRGTVDVDGFPSGGECNQTVDCGEFTNTVNCPSCPSEFFINEITPSALSASTPTPVTFTGTGFIHSIRVFLDGIEYTSFISGQTVTTLVVVANVLGVEPGLDSLRVSHIFKSTDLVTALAILKRDRAILGTSLEIISS